MENLTTKKMLLQLVKIAPGWLLAAMMISFLFLGTIQVFYYQRLLEPNIPTVALPMILSIGFALLIQAARAGFALVGVRDFALGKSGIGFLGFFFSGGLSVFESFEVNHIAVFFSTTNPAVQPSFVLMLQACVWAGLVLEVRLLMSIVNALAKEKDELEANHSPTRTQNQLENDLLELGTLYRTSNGRSGN